jgi:hypothetical protein
MTAIVVHSPEKFRLPLSRRDIILVMRLPTRLRHGYCFFATFPKVPSLTVGEFA